MKKSGHRYGYLVHSQIDSTGQTLPPPERNSLVSSLSRQKIALRRLFGMDAPANAPPQQIGSVYQFQLFVESPFPLSEDDERRVRERFFQAYSTINKQVF